MLSTFYLNEFVLEYVVWYEYVFESKLLCPNNTRFTHTLKYRSQFNHNFLLLHILIFHLEQNYSQSSPKQLLITIAIFIFVFSAFIKIRILQTKFKKIHMVNQY